MNRDTPLFREEAINRGRVPASGEIVLVRPLSLGLLTIAALLATITVAAFLFFGSYTRRTTSLGQLVPDRGLIRLQSPQSGVVAEKRVVEGQQVEKGDVLYVLTSERRSLMYGEAQALASNRVEERLSSLREQVARTRSLADSDLAAARRKHAALLRELRAMNTLAEGLERRAQLAVDRHHRYVELHAKGYVSREQVAAAESDALEQRSRLEELARDRLSLRRQVVEQQNIETTLPMRYQDQVAELEQSIASTEQELSESESRRRWVVVAPEAGVVTAVVAEVGHSIEAGRPLVAIVPLGSVLLAHLYAPSSSIGFVRPGDVVQMRIQSYPYQKFGHQRGVVLSVSSASVSPTDLLGIEAAQSVFNRNEPVYRITVELDSQQVRAYGAMRQLQAGMLLEADVMQEERRLFEWVFEPLTTLTGKVG